MCFLFFFCIGIILGITPYIHTRSLTAAAALFCPPSASRSTTSKKLPLLRTKIRLPCRLTPQRMASIDYRLDTTLSWKPSLPGSSLLASPLISANGSGFPSQMPDILNPWRCWQTSHIKLRYALSSTGSKTPLIST